MDSNSINPQQEPTVASDQSPADPATTSPVMTPTARKPKIPQKLPVALLIFTLASAAAVALLPHIAQAFGNGDQPSLLQLALTGLVMIGLTTVLLGYASKIVGLSRAWLILALTYNAMIILVKFVLSPASLYSQTITLGIGSFDPNNSSGFILVELIVMLLYLIVFKVIQSIYERKVSRGLSLPEQFGQMQKPSNY
jgi:hypothetical protein